MTDFQTEKDLVRSYYAALETCDLSALREVVSKYLSADTIWRGFHPIGELSGPDAVAEKFWLPLRTGLTSLQRRMDLFFAGKNEIDGFQSVWVASMGHLVGLFDEPWLGIPPTQKMAFLPYAAFHKVVDGKIVDTAMYFDVPHLMAQAGCCPFQTQTAARLFQPGPITHTGLLFEDQPKQTGQKTLATINAMINDLGTWQLGLPLEEELARTWHNDMIWWGPTGIGAAYTIERYAKQHSAPFRAAFSERSRTGHLCRMAEGEFGGFFGWPNFTAVQSGEFMGRPATNMRGEMRVIDMYRRSGDKLAENWVFIDLLNFWKGLGWDAMQEALASQQG